MFRRLIHSTFATVSAPGQGVISFLESCGQGLLRQTRFQVAGFCLAVLSLTMYHVNCFGQSPGTITVKLYSDAVPSPEHDLGKVPIAAPGGTRVLSLYATADPSPADLTWEWSDNATSGDPPTSSATAELSIDESGDQSISVSVTADSVGGSGGEAGGPASGTDSINIKAIVVKVTSIELKDGVAETKNIGDSLVKDDFNITTEPSGNEDEDIVVVSSVMIQPGDNIVTATCGYSSASTNVTAGLATGSFGDLTLPPPSAEYGFLDFHVLCIGAPGTYEVSSPDGASVSGDTSGSVGRDVPYDSYVTTSPGGGSAGASSAMRGTTMSTGLAAIATDPNSVVLANPLLRDPKKILLAIEVTAAVATTAAIYISGWGEFDEYVSPAGRPEMGIAPQFGQGWNPTGVRAKCNAEINGMVHEWAWRFQWVSGAQATIEIDTPSDLQVTYNGFAYDVNTQSTIEFPLFASVTDPRNGSTSHTFDYPGSLRDKSAEGTASLYVQDGGPDDTSQHMGWNNSSQDFAFIYHP